MTTSKNHAAEMARIIVDNQSVYTRTNGDPFFFSSGWASPIFIDCKKLISTPEDRDILIDMAVECISENIDLDTLDVIAGCELAGISFATLVADRLGKPLVIACKKSKGYGRLSQVEGNFEAGQRVLLIDDLATDGASEMTFRSVLQRAEAETLGTFVLVDFNVFPPDQNMISLANLNDIVSHAKSTGYLGNPEFTEVQKFIRNAPEWSRQHGGIKER